MPCSKLNESALSVSLFSIYSERRLQDKQKHESHGLCTPSNMILGCRLHLLSPGTYSVRIDCIKRDQNPHIVSNQSCN